MAYTDPMPTPDYPLLRENIWQITPEEPLAYVETPDGCFEVETGQALAFLRVRPHCTPHNNVARIAERSGTHPEQVSAMLAALDSIGAIGPRRGDVIERLTRAVELWGAELARDFIANALLDEAMPRTVLLGWLLETYHYVRDFPEAIAEAAARAPEGPLRQLLLRYVAEERGHERFVLETLENLGLSRAEVEASHPLISTRMIGFLMRDLFAAAPVAVLLMAAMVEAQAIPDERTLEFQHEIERHFDLAPGALGPYFKHQEIDARLGHHRLFADNLACFDIEDEAVLDLVVDRLHDLKHGFDLQGLEIRHYYGGQDGAYLPRQPMPMRAI
ncbi:iron-containing redox enzyme family protein [Sphingomonas kyeonggiensis]|uniref:Thiaminase-2/PQQC domain-containing protein n=1 Tax=Sphingomonas kyeonggiensis TaxID=1268553 RepID=A0A7W6JXV2_9SPHN|nr:iron-containing redox enzyme family protein [Sphingomonas kyeonggiensis]MBB4100430.1 hypothetical protein [Sphingomonas kyeonggiensis]